MEEKTLFVPRDAQHTERKNRYTTRWWWRAQKHTREHWTACALLLQLSYFSACFIKWKIEEIIFHLRKFLLQFFMTKLFLLSRRVQRRVDNMRVWTCHDNECWTWEKIFLKSKWNKNIFLRDEFFAREVLSSRKSSIFRD
jgi:hypothetical protein